MSLQDTILKLTRQLYPTGRALRMPFGGELEKLHKGLARSEARSYTDAVSVLNSALPDNDDFTSQDATDWERRLGLITNTSISLADRILAIRSKIQHPGSIKARQHYLYLERQLQAVGFNVFVHENKFFDSQYHTILPPSGTDIVANKITAPESFDLTGQSNKWSDYSTGFNQVFSSIAYGAGLFVAVGTTGTNRVITSPDGITWTARSVASALNGVTYGGGLFVAVGGNTVLTSPDGITWTSRTAAASNNWVGVTFGNSLFVAVSNTGTGNRVMTSPDGITWTSRTSAANNGWSSVAYGASQYIAVADSGTSNRIMTSPDGIAWTLTAQSQTIDFTSIAHGNGMFVAIGVPNTGVNNLATSPDGFILWTQRTIVNNPDVSNVFKCVAFGNGIFVAVGSNGAMVMTSVDGINWKKQKATVDSWQSVVYGQDRFVAIDSSANVGNPNKSLVSLTLEPYRNTFFVGGEIETGVNWTAGSGPGGFSWNSVIYANGIYVAVSGTHQVMTSLDAVTWTARTSPSLLWFSVAFGNGLFVAVASSGTGDRVMTSPDGITWTSRTSAADNDWRSVTFGNSLFVAVSNTGTGNRVMTSPDGITWTSRTSAADNNWNSVTYGNGLFVAVASTGTGNRVMTSPNGITWTSRTSAADNSWNEVTYGAGLFVAVSSTGTNRVMTSPDGITWTIRIASDSRNSVTYGNGHFVAVGGNTVGVSPDGITWTSHAIPVSGKIWASITYNEEAGTFVAVATDGTTDNIMTSFIIAEADVPEDRELEFRQLILKTKPTHTVGFLVVNYV